MVAGRSLTSDGLYMTVEQYLALSSILKDASKRP
jgi:hypothetical protein